MNFSEKVFLISPQANYLQNLAQFVLSKVGDDIFKIANAKIFVPNRRSVNALKQQFYALSNNNSCILPQIFAIGDIDENEFETSFVKDLPIEEFEVFNKNVISKTARKIILTNLIFEKNNLLNNDDNIFTLEHAANLANSLLDFFDEVQKNEIDFKNLNNIVPENLAEYWNKSLDFLKLAAEEYPKILAKKNLVDPIFYRNQVINFYTKILAENKSDNFVFVAGTTGSQAATRRFIKAILQLENGYFILPYTDNNYSDEIWQKLDEEENHLNHQYLIKKLLDYLQINRSDIQIINSQQNSHKAFISEVFKPASEVINWVDFKVESTHLKNIKLIEAENIIAEAKAVTLILRQAAQENKTVLIVTNNSNLVEYVQTYLKKFEISIDYSGGKRLLKTPVAKFFLQIAKLVQGKFKTTDFLFLLKNPFLNIASKPQNYKDFISKLEEKIIRKNKIKFCNELKNLCTNKHFSNDEIDFLSSIFNLLDGLQAAFNHKQVNIVEFLKLHISTTENLSENIFKTDEGDQLMALLNDVLSSQELKNLSYLNDYLGLLENLFADAVYKKAFGFDDKFIILTPIEARLQYADIVILTDLNEGRWPKISDNPWLSEEMKVNFGLPSVNNSIALSCHDFVSHLHAPQVYLTRSLKSSDGLNVESPFLSRLKTFYKLHKIENYFTPEIDYINLSKFFDGEHLPIQKISAPIPLPDKNSRPKKLSATKIEKLIKNPYAIYAAEILKLKPLDELEEDDSKSLFGTVLHKILEEFALHHQLDVFKINFETLMQIGLQNFAPYKSSDAYNIWLTKFEQIAKWFVNDERERVKNIAKIFTERKEQIKLNVKDDAFVIEAIADRIEVLQSGEVNIADYKTGKVPVAADVKNLYKPQLLIEALILKKLEEFINTQKFYITYYNFSGTIKNFSAEQILAENIDDLIVDVEQQLENLISDLLNEQKPFLVNPHTKNKMKIEFDEYKHLSREAEWG
jgi:ATP-dependent helicase/nuclease subunit B